MTVSNSIRESVVDYCAKIGVDSMLVQGAGGNVSWKDRDTLWVKASGTWLADAKVKDIFVPVDLSDLHEKIKAGNFAVVPNVKSDSKFRPSIETLLHALMPHRVVVHVHAIEALVYLVRENVASEIREKLSLLNLWALVNYQKPGEALAEAVANTLVKSPDVEILLLQNHGIVIGGDNVAEVEAKLSQLLSKLKAQYIDVGDKSIPESICIGSTHKYLPVDILGIHNLAIEPYLFSRVKNDWALYPDHVVFLGHGADCYDSVKVLHEELSSDRVPELVFVKGLGVFAKAAFSIAKQAQLKCYFDVIMRQPKQTSLKILSKQEVAQLLDWDAEHYRQNIAK
jgi:rhamnose utilization protein RhaD (predicted bifunctional aldolase and dehydrogenase)